MSNRPSLALCVSLAVLAGAAHAAMNNEPADFRGIPFGAPIDSFKKELVQIADQGDTVYYRRPSDQLSWGGAEIQKISYRFIKGRFSGVTLQLFGAPHQKAITEKLFGLHGTPEQPNKRVPQYVWTGDKTSVMLFCEVTAYCVVELQAND